AGNTTLTVCQNSNYACASLYVTVSGTGLVLGSYAYNNGQLINDNGTVYVIYKNTKTAFASANVFLALGYKFSNVVAGSTSQFSNTGYIIRNTKGSHPWGSWLKSGQTVYFVHETGLIPVPDYS